jgi:hypothetical protein
MQKVTGEETFSGINRVRFAGKESYPAGSNPKAEDKLARRHASCFRRRQLAR